MRHFSKLAIVLLAIAAFSVTMPPLLTATIRDALLDFLDQPTADRVIDYARRTETSRAIGLALLLSGWTVFLVLVHVVVDAVWQSPNTQSHVVGRGFVNERRSTRTTWAVCRLPGNRLAVGAAALRAERGAGNLVAP